MMNRIDVNIIEMPLEITLVADRVLPEPPLPDALLALCAPTVVSKRSVVGPDVRAGKRFFDQTPTGLKVHVALGQRPKRVQMVRKDDISIELKWMPVADFFDAFHQKRDRLGLSEQRAAILGNQSKEESAAAHSCAPIAHRVLPMFVGSRKGSTQPTVLGLASARPNLRFYDSAGRVPLTIARSFGPNMRLSLSRRSVSHWRSAGPSVRAWSMVPSRTAMMRLAFR